MKEETRAWHSRPGVARALRIAIVVAPIVITIVLVTIVSRGFPRPSSLAPAIGWWVAISAFSTLLLAMVDRLFRRLLPIAALFKISLVFPDSAPSRFSTALRTGTVKQLKRKMASGELEAATPQEAAEQLIGIAAALNEHDRLTRGHTERVRAYSVMIGEEMGLDEAEINLLNWSGLIHDVGKLHVPTEILNKPGRPDDDEWAILREHPAHGGELIDPLRDFLGDFAESATQHHEKFDGTGYPLGLAGTEITLAGRIVAVADAYDVMTSTRSYKKPMTAEAAREELAKNSGTQFDPEVVRAFLNIALGHLRLVAGPLAGLAQLPLPTAATAGAGSAAATGASAAATIAVATVTGLVDPVPPEEPPPAVAFAEIDAPDLEFDGTEDEQFVFDLRAAVEDLDVVFVLPTNVEGATVAVSPEGVLTVDPEPDRNGRVEIPYRACLVDRCDAGSVVVNLRAVNDAPSGGADLVDVASGAVVPIDVLANDVDPDGDQLELISVTQPPSGSARIVDNRLELETADESAEFTLTYTAVDAAGEVIEATVTVTVTRVPVGPTATNDQVVVLEDAVATIDPLANDLAGDVRIDPDTLALDGAPPVGIARVIDGTIEWIPERDWNGTVGFSYRICDIDGLCDDAAVAITVDPVNDPPQFTLRNDVAVAEDAGSTSHSGFIASSSAGPADESDQAIVYSASVDDPTLFAVLPQVDSTGTLTFTSAADRSGTASITVTATDGGGTAGGGRNRSSETTTISILSVNDGPTVSLGVNLSLTEDAPAQRWPDWITDVSPGPSDEADQTVAFRTVADRPELFSAVPSVDAAGTLTFTPAPDAVGATTITVVAIDSDGASGTTASRTITLLEINDPPTFALAGDITVNEDAGAQVERGFATGISAGPPSERSQTIAFELAHDNDALFSDPPTIDTDGTLRFTSAPNAFGSASVTVRLVDDGGTETGGVDTAESSFIIVVTSDNGTPVAVLDRGIGFSTDEDTAFTTADVLANDIDEEGPLSGARIEIVEDVNDGTLVPNGDGTFDYDPDPDHNGADGFTYRVQDEDGAWSQPVKVELVINPVNDAPVAQSDAGVGFTTTEDTAFTTASVLTNDSDVDDAIDPASVVVVGDAANGTVVSNGDGTFDYDPDPNFAGTDSFTYSATDGAGLASNVAAVQITVTGENDAPVAVADLGVGWTTTEDTPFTTPDVTANDTDIDGSIDPTSVQVVNPPTGGVLTNNGDGTFDYEPTADFAGADAFSYQVDDDQGATSNVVVVSLVITGTNDAPTARNDGTDGSIRTDEDTSFTTPDVLANDSDVDGTIQPATVVVTADAANGTLTYNGDGTFDYTPDPDFEGQEDIRYTVDDNDGATSNEAILRIFVDAQNDRPVANGDSGIGFTTSEGQIFTTIDVTDNDADVDDTVDPSSVAIVDDVNAGTLTNNGDGTFDYEPIALYNGSDSFTYTITDPSGATSDPATVTLTITAVNDKPVANDDSGVGFAGTEDQTFTTADVTANDTDPEDGAPDASTVVIVDDPSAGSLVNNGDGTFDYTPDADANGDDTFTYRVADSSGVLSDPATVTVSITSVNDAPSFTRGPNLSMLVDAGTLTIDDWATNVDAGAANESGQSVTFELTPADAAFFDEQPAINAAGQLTLRVATGVSGTTTVAIVARDDGGVANGGVDSTPAITLEVLVSNDDFDGVAQNVDNAPVLYNPLQIDTDGDGIGDVADPTPTAVGSTGVFSYTGQLANGDPLESGSLFKSTDAVAADFDGDGRLDLAVATEQQGTFVWINRPTGFDLPSPTNLPSDDEVRAITAGDLDGDGDLDLVMGQVGGGNETWINDGTGSFTLAETLGAFNTEGIVVGDVDGDGDLDVVAANDQGYNAVRLNDGTGVFTLSQVFGSETTKERAIAIDDVDGDFDLDLVIGIEKAPNEVWLNDGTGNFVDSGQALGTDEKTRELILRDFDGDGDVDLLVGEDNDPDTYWVNQGNGTFVDSGQSLGLNNTHGIAVGDVDGDGDLDVVFGDDNSDSSVWLNDGSETFTDSGQSITPAGKTEKIMLNDFTADGALDIVTIRDDQPLQFYVGGIN